MPKDVEGLVRKFAEKWGPMDARPEFMKEFVGDLYDILQEALASDGRAIFARRGVHGQGGAGFEEAVVATRDKLLEAVKAHEADGKPCWDERVNVIAYLSHSVRLSPTLMPSVLSRMREFDHGHEERQGGERGAKDPDRGR